MQDSWAPFEIWEHEGAAGKPLTPLSELVRRLPAGSAIAAPTRDRVFQELSPRLRAFSGWLETQVITWLDGFRCALPILRVGAHALP